MASALTRQGLMVESAHAGGRQKQQVITTLVGDLLWVAIIGSEKEGGPDFLRSA